jgi:hypothetical protein
MDVEPEDDGIPAASGGDDAVAASREHSVERIRFLFRLAGNNAPAIELEQQIMTYRLMEKQP